MAGRRKRSQLLLIELLITLIAFMICMAVLMQVYMSAERTGSLSRKQSLALNEAQDLAEQLYASNDWDAGLEALAFTRSDDGTWTRDDGRTTISVDAESTGAGTLYTAHIGVYYDDASDPVTLTGAKYIPTR